MQRKLVVTVCVLVVFLGILSGIVSANSPANSSFGTRDWAYYAIEDLGRSRHIPDFSMPTELNRNQGALLVARLLQHLSGEEHPESRRFGLSKNVYLDNMIFSYNQRVAPELALTGPQVESLYRLVLEYRHELEILGYAIQDFNLLHEQGWVKEQDGLFARRPLLYSEQAVAAARKLEEETLQVSFSLASGDLAPEKIESSITEIFPAPIEPRNLWTGQFSSATRYLPPASSFIALEPQPDPSTSIQIGGIEVSGGLRSTPSSSQTLETSTSSEGGPGYGISVKVGDLALKTAIDLAVDPSLAAKVASTSVDLSLDWADLFTVSAGYKDFLKDPASSTQAPVVTSLGVVVPITRGKVHLGMTQEWGKFSGGEGNDSSGGELGEGTFLPKSGAELGLSYDFENDSSLRFNYRLIDFSDVEQDYKAKAEFSIKF